MIRKEKINKSQRFKKNKIVTKTAYNSIKKIKKKERKKEKEEENEEEN